LSAPPPKATPAAPEAPKEKWRPRVPRRVAAYFNERVLLKYIVLTGLGGFLLGYIVITILFFPGFGRSAIVTVPDLRGKSASAAERTLEKMGLEMKRGPALPNPQMRAGSVLSQVPLPGQEVQRGTQIRVFVSAGPERRPVPSIAGLGREEAVTLLQRMGFTVRERKVLDDSPEGRLLGMEPRAGTQLGMPGVVTLTVSAGPPKVVVPSVVTLPEPQARERLEAAGLRLGNISYDPDSSEPLGGIASQRPAAGDSLARGRSVSVVISGTDPDPAPPEPDSAQAEPAEEPQPEPSEPEPSEPKQEPQPPGATRG
jgi:beta-lactam-binding protein with PASTA domain